MAGPAAVDLKGLMSRPLCVQCRRCGRKTVFGSTSAEARLSDEKTTSRLVCRSCGGRGVKAIRLCDDREAKRWFEDR